MNTATESERMTEGEIVDCLAELMNAWVDIKGKIRSMYPDIEDEMADKATGEIIRQNLGM